ncbi:MAG: enoyl-CoA hydratase/isomerase family protein [Desulfobacteraceae bacterium]|nr:MAG: enoyl-CoA hydratase/isomerase family protein [Desulfobacteraceae bacterium]
MSFNCIILDIQDQIATISFNRPKALNALSNELFDELDQAVGQIRNNKEIKVLILTGAGDKAFVAGADISELAAMDALKSKFFSKKGQDVMGQLETLPIPVIAAVNGYALGGGLEAAMVCDFIYASEKAVFGLPEITLGLIPGFGGTQRLARLVGNNMAKELIFTGKSLTAAEALEVGIVNKVCPPESLMDEVMSTAVKIARMGRVALRAAKETVHYGSQVDLETGCKIENDNFGLCMASPDAKEGTSAFLEKRKPEFKGELF